MRNRIAIIISGRCIGSLLGLSRSEVLGNVLAPFITVIASLMSVLTGIKFFDRTDENQSKARISDIDSTPLMWLLIGILVGSLVGIYVRNFNLLSPHEITLNNKKDEEFENDSTSQNLTGLYASSSKVCKDYNLCNLSGASLICELAKIETPTIEKLIADKNNSIETIENKIRKLCDCK